MFFGTDQVVAHLVGDYILQSHWMATQKTKSSWAAGTHAFVYTLPFIIITQNPWALLIICVSHFFIDRFRLARFVVYIKELCFNYGKVPFYGKYEPMTATGFPFGTPDWLAVWLLIIVDNTIHILINGVAIYYFN
jgi:hypothetical protein